MKGKNRSCKVLFVMMKNLNSFNCFSFGNDSLWSLTIHVSRLAGTSLTVTTETFNSEGQKFQVIHQIMKTDPQVSLFNINNIEIIHAPRKSG